MTRLTSSLLALWIAFTPSLSAAQDWSGFAIGGSIGAIEGEGTVGAFVRRQGQIGSFVYGGEIAFTGMPGSGRASAADAVPSDQFWDVKGRFGYAFGQVMPYAGLGLSVLGTQDNVLFDDFGFVSVVGLDYQASEHVVVGAEYQYLTPFSENLFAADVADLRAVSVRMAYRF